MDEDVEENGHEAAQEARLLGELGEVGTVQQTQRPAELQRALRVLENGSNGILRDLANVRRVLEQQRRSMKNKR